MVGKSILILLIIVIAGYNVYIAYQLIASQPNASAVSVLSMVLAVLVSFFAGLAVALAVRK